MKIHFEHGKTAFTFEREPMPPERFTALCKLAGAVIGGAVLLGLAHMLGVFGVVWPLVGLVATGLYRLIKSGVID